MGHLAGALTGEDVGLCFCRPTRWGRAKVGVSGTIGISLGEGWEPPVDELDEPGVVCLTVLGKGKLLGSPEDIVVLVDCPVVLVHVVLAKLCLALETTEAFVGAVGERMKLVGECREA